METNTNMPQAMPQMPAEGTQSMPDPSATHTPPPPHKSIKGPIIAAIVVLLLGGTAYAGYYFGYFDKILGISGPDKREAMDMAIKNLETIDTARYRASFSVTYDDRDPNIQSFDALFSDDIDKITEQVGRDQDKLRSVGTIIGDLETFYNQNAAYPASPSELASGNIFANSGFQYTTVANGTDYILDVEFESAEAINRLKDAFEGIQIEGNKVSFDRDHGRSFSLRAMRLKVAPTYLPDFDTESMDEVFEYITDDFEIEFSAGGATQVDGDYTNAEFDLDARANISFFNFSVALGFIKFQENYYFKIDDIPALFADFSEIEGKWIEASETDVANDLGDLSFFSYITEESEDEYENTSEQVRLFFQRAYEEGVFDINYDLMDEGDETTGHFVYGLDINGANAKAFYRKIVNEFEEKYGDKSIVKSSNAWEDFFASAEMQKYVDYFNASTDIKAYVNKETNFLERYNIKLNFVPSSKSRVDDKQLSFGFDLSLSDINQDLSINRPAEYITLEDAIISMTGMTREEYRFNKQLDNVRRVRSALTQYHSYTGKYPLMLSDLEKSRAEVTKQEGARDYYDEEQPFLEAVPNDVYSGNSYTYSINQVEDNYSLGYNISKTGLEVNENMSLSQFLSVADGQNYSDSTNVSLQVKALLETDSDSDGLPDFVEEYYGTSSASTDSDNDGYNDLDEVKAGYDPAGSGTLEYYERWNANVYLY